MMNLHHFFAQKSIVLSFCLFTIATLSLCSRYYLSQSGQEIQNRFTVSPDHHAGSFMEGTRYETPCYLFSTPKPDPSILIIGGTHGDEPAGYESAYRLMAYFSDHPLKRGQVFIVPEANRQAVINRKSSIPVPPRQAPEKGDLNQCYPGKSDGLPMERQAYELVRLIREEGIALILDLQESDQFYIGHYDTTDQYKNLGQTLIYAPEEKARRIGKSVMEDINDTISGFKKKFNIVEKPLAHSAAWVAGERFNIPGFAIVTCKKLPLEERIAYQRKIVLATLKKIGMY